MSLKLINFIRIRQTLLIYMNHYKHTQVGTLIIIMSLTGLVFILTMVLLSNFHVFILFPVILLILAILLFGTLTVEIDDRHVFLKFGIGWIRKKIRLDDILDHRIVRNKWYYGWGIRYTPNGTLYNVSGLDAVELRLRNRKKIRIGTDDPEGLSAALSNRS